MKVTPLLLTEADVRTLERESWIDPDSAKAWGLYRVTSLEGAELVGRSDRNDYAGIVFPTYWPGDDCQREFFLRRDRPEYELRDGHERPKQKYLAPPGRGNLLICGPGESAEALEDTTIPILLVEGLKKVVAARRLARWNSDSSRFLAMGLTGAWNFRGTIGRTVGPNGERISIKGTIPDFDRITWTDRNVSLVYDSDAETNRSVWAAREALADDLRARGAKVIIMVVPPLDGLIKTGVDDLLARWGPERAIDWLHAGENGAALCDDPEPISLDSSEIPTFSTTILPVEWLRSMIEATSAATETPIELPLLLALAVTATAVQKGYVVEPEAGYREPLNIWVCPALDSGNRKTAVLREMTMPLLNFERHHAALIAQEVTRAEAARRLSEDRIKYLRQRAAKAKGDDFDSIRQQLLDEEQAMPEVPQGVRLWAQDVTPEKLGALMAEHNQAMAILSDEGGVFDILAGRYSQGMPNLDLFLQAHSGAPYRVDRGSRSPVFMENPALTIALSPQPSVLKGIAKIPGFRGRGLLARFFYALPHSTLGHRTLNARAIPEGIRGNYCDYLFALLKQPPREDGRPHTIRFSPEAYREWKAFQRHVEVELPNGGMFEHIRDWAAKLPGGVARLAGILHCAQYADDNPQSNAVRLSTMEAALGLGAILERHALAAFSLMAVDSAVDAAQKVWTWIVRQRQSIFVKRNCFQALKGLFPNMVSLQPAFDILTERGYIFPLPPDKRVGRPSYAYRVNNRIAEGWK